LAGTNHFHGRVYEYFQNRNLNAIDATTARTFTDPAVKPFNDFNRYGGQVGGPILKDKLFFFGNFERQTTGKTTTYAICTPTAAGFAALKAIPTLNQNNLAIFNQYVPVSPGTTGIDASVDSACGNQKSGAQFTPVFSGPNGTGTVTKIPLGNYQVAGPNFTNFDALATSVDYISRPNTLRFKAVRTRT
jgi:hypothetical protein